MPLREEPFFIRSGFCFHRKGNQKTKTPSSSFVFQRYIPLCPQIVLFRPRFERLVALLAQKKTVFEIMKGKKNILKSNFLVFQRSKIPHIVNHTFDHQALAEATFFLPMGGQNLKDLANMARGTWSLMLDYVPIAAFMVAVLVASLG